MLELEMERRHLAKADRDIADGEERIVRQAMLVEKLRCNGHDVGTAEMLLTNLRQTQDAWWEHRALIVSAIARLEQDQA